MNYKDPGHSPERAKSHSLGHAPVINRVLTKALKGQNLKA
jgi:hypothetical protein